MQKPKSNCLKVSILSIFPNLFSGFASESLVGKAAENDLLSLEIINIRDFSDPPHFRVDDTPYGGGPGMVMRAEPVCRAVEKAKQRLPAAKVILLSASGSKFTQSVAQELSALDELILICGRYEGIDQRAIESCVDHEYSIGDFILMGGEVGAMAIIESVVRLRPGVLGNECSCDEESFSIQDGSSILLEAPQYTKPAEIRGKIVPDVLLSGNHDAIRKWRREQSRIRTARLRPDLLEGKQ